LILATALKKFRIDRFGGDYRNFSLKAATRRRCNGACTERQQMPGLDLCATGICRTRRALLLEKEIKPPRRKPGFFPGVVRLDGLFVGRTKPTVSRMRAR